MTYLLDANLCICYLRGRVQPVLERFQSHHPDELSVCATVRSELIFGALKSRDPEANIKSVHQFLAPLCCHPFESTIADVAAEIRANLSATGNSIGPYDLQIAATALAHGLILVTHNVAEFSRVPNLRIEDWEA